MIAIDKPNLAVDGTVTVGLKNGESFTYRIQEAKRGALKGKRIVSLLTGPNNQQDYTGWGFVLPSYPAVSGPDTKPSSWYVAVWNRLKHSKAYVKHADLLEGRCDDEVNEWLQAGRCMICGRPLTNLESLHRGIGPVCDARER